MITDDELDSLANSLGCEITYLGNDCWECISPAENWCGENSWYGDYLQIFQLLEDLRADRTASEARGIWDAVALKA